MRVTSASLNSTVGEKGRAIAPGDFCRSDRFQVALNGLRKQKVTRGESTGLMRKRAADGGGGQILHRLPVNEGQANADLFGEFTRVVLWKVISASPPRVINGDAGTSTRLWPQKCDDNVCF